MAEKTIGSVLNEAADANDRTAESSRRQAISNVQLRGMVDEQNDKGLERKRAKDFLDGSRKIYDEEMFVNEPVNNQPEGAIPAPDAQGNFPAQQFVKKPRDPSSREGMEALGRVQSKQYALRMSLGMAKPDEMNSLLDFRKKLENAGAAEDFKKALTGDPSAIETISKKFGLQGLKSIVSGQDDHGFLNLFAMTETPDGAKGRVPIGHLAAAFLPEIDSLLKGSRDDAKEAAAMAYQKQMGQSSAISANASMLNARTNESRASQKSAWAEQYRVFADIEGKNDRDYVLPGFTTIGPTGKAEIIKDDGASGIVNQLGALLIEKDEFSGGQAHIQARSMLAGINSKARSMYETELASAKAAADQLAADKKTPADALRKARATVMQLEDSGPAYFSRYRQNLVQTMLDKAAQKKSSNEAIKK